MVRDYYILGAGISGLTTAYELLKRGCHVHLFEKELVPGGLARTLQWNGMPIDFGPHIYHTANQDIVEYWKKEFKGVLFKREHWSKNFKNGVFYDYPISYESIEKLPLNIRTRIKEELGKKDLAGLKAAKNYYEYMQALAGKTLQELFFIRYPEKVWGMSVKELDANWAPKRLEIRQQTTPFYWKQWCAVGIDGSGSIINRLYENLKKLGCEIFLGEEVKRLNILDERIRCIVTRKQTISVRTQDIVINTLSCTTISKLLGLSTDLRYRGVIIVYLSVVNPVVFPKNIDFLYFDDPQLLFHRISRQSRFVKNFPKNKEIYVCEIAYSKGDHNDRKKDKDLASEVVSQCQSLGFINTKKGVVTKIIKLPEVYPSFSVGYRNKLTKTMAEIESVLNLYTLGSLAEYDYSDLQILFSKAMDLTEVLTNKTFRVNKMDKNMTKISFEKEIAVGAKTIGVGSPTFVIAEIGINHNGDLKLAKRLVDEAVRSGADAVKFQSYKAQNRIAKYGKTSKYAEKTLQIEETDYEMLKKCELSKADMKELFRYVKGRTIVFSTPFELDSVDELKKLNVGLYKISSFDLTNIPLLQKVGLTGKPAIVSTGMSDLSEVEDALKAFASSGNKKVALLHCVSAYPCSPEEMNLKAMDTLRAAFGVPVGLSDHTVDDVIVLAAVARGANVIEKHFTLDRNMEGPDHALSLTPDEFKAMVQKIRTIEKSLGDGIKRSLAVEFPSMLRFRKTMYASRDIKAGAIITEKDIVFKGPAYGIYPKYMDIIIGQRALKIIQKDNPITWESIGYE